MTNHVPATLANTSDAIFCDKAAEQVKAAESAGMRGILTAAIFLKLRGDNKVNTNTLFLAFAKVTAESSANNYVSKSRAAAMAEHFPWAVDVNASLDDTLDRIMPEFRAYWGAVNGIKKTGPGKAAPTARKAAEKPEAPLPLKEATALQVHANLAGRLSERNPDGSFALDMATLVALRDAINAEIAARQAEVMEAKQAA